MRTLKSLCAFAILTHPVIAPALHFGFDSRADLHQARASEAVETLSLEWRRSASKTALLFRLRHLATSANQVDFGASTEWLPRTWVKLHTRYSVSYRLTDPWSQATWLGSLSLGLPAHLRIVPYLEVGWSQRWSTFGRHSLGPVVGAGFAHGDLAIDIGVWARLWGPLRSRLRLSTIDVLDVYNLNHPFVELSAQYGLAQQPRFLVYSRYHALLGFGRVDTWTFGMYFAFGLV